ISFELVIVSSASFSYLVCFFFFNDTATTELYTLSLHDALPIYVDAAASELGHVEHLAVGADPDVLRNATARQLEVAEHLAIDPRSEEHTSELQSRGHLVCRLLLEKKKEKSCPPPT